jgi:hypothetical protein
MPSWTGEPKAMQAAFRAEELLRRAHAEGHLPVADAWTVSEAIEGRRATLAGGGRLDSSKAASGLPRASKRALPARPSRGHQGLGGRGRSDMGPVWFLGDNGWRWRVLRTSNAYNFLDPGSLEGTRKPITPPLLAR